MEEPVRVGLIGAGPWARQVHAPGLADHPGTELTSVWSRRADAARDLAHAHGARPAADLGELLGTVDAVSFAVPPSVQAELAGQAVAAGRHVILEKPLASTVDDAARLAGAISDAGVVGLMVLTRRFAPETANWLDEVNRVGGWSGGSARWLSGALLGDTYGGSAWRQADGALADIGPHALDLLDAALGPITEVLAVGHRAEHDLWHVLLGHESGATSTAALALRLPVQPTAVEFAVYGEPGMRTLPGRATPALDCYTCLLDHFVAMVDCGKTDHACDAQRGLHLQRVLDTIRKKAG
jgi:predicted dehydrogenase